MGGLLYDEGNSGGSVKMGTLGIGVSSVDVAKLSTGLPNRDRASMPRRRPIAELNTVESILSYNHSLHGLELILHGESPS